MKHWNDILVDIHGSVCVITLNRPSRLNAWTDAMRAEVAAAFSDAEKDDTIGAIVLTGAGDRAFCSGQDFKEMQSHDAASAAAWMEDLASFFDLFRSSSKPTVAALNGLAVGSAFQVALFCDIRIAHLGVRLGQPEINHGVASITGPWIMREMLGLSRTVELVLTGRLMGCEECHALGLVHEVVRAGEVLPRAISVAEELARKPKGAMRKTKAWLRQMTMAGFESAAQEAVRAHSENFASGEPGKHLKNFIDDRTDHV
ncbi:enoyl-CoA hydratase/isomerase family protein [Rhizobium leguminosarum]|uniref:enoyl-CoA hydratase/isomerase family protein n=1 Tax=Rhizobium leguminosarum TaxID=384 RepID=UPI0024A9367F|nr:enoyl-CoA hydratase/isomerase family protein [Rhizobium leguminosarum]MDI5929673.1 enoyl-CoA hydratase/isomerase family protein [Rhizobium leguminosarum]